MMYVPDTFSLDSVIVTEAVRRARMKRRGKLQANDKQTFSWLCQQFRESPKFLELSRNTQVLWGRELDFACRDDILGAA